jgi:hypothetical protein
MRRLSGILLVSALFVVGCGASESGDTSLAVAIEQTYLTIGNKTGSALAEGEIELVPAGVLAPYRTTMPRIESGQERQVRFELFSGAGGQRFRRGVTRIRTVRVTATDIAGKKYQREVPFN